MRDRATVVLVTDRLDHEELGGSSQETHGI